MTLSPDITSVITRLRSEIWDAAEHDTKRIDKAKQLAGDPSNYEGGERGYDYWSRILLLIHNRKPVKKSGKAKLHTPQHVRDRYAGAYVEWQKQNYPQWCADGHLIPEPKWPDIHTANGLQNFIVNFLTWEGHFGNRTGNEGRVIMKDGKPIRIPNQSKNGQQDVDVILKHPAHPHGIPWRIEVKVGRDTQKKAQEKFEAAVLKTGAVYSLIKTAEQFLVEYDKLVSSVQTSAVKP